MTLTPSCLRLPARERRFALAAFAMLVFLMGSHTMLETARDALFLARVSAAYLPWLYLAVAAVSMAIVQLGGRFGPAGPRGLTSLIVGGAAITLGVGEWVRHAGISGVYVLYVWTAAQTTVITLRFWVLLGGVFTVTQAKRLYGIIGTGSVLGAVAGAGLSRLVAEWLPPAAMVPVAGALLLCAAGSSLPFWKVRSIAIAEADAASEPFVASLRRVHREPLAMRLAMLILLATVTVTFVDFLFKRTVAAQVPEQDLAAYFATVNLLFNAGSLVVQVLLVAWVVQRFNVLGALSVMPALLGGGATLFLLLPALLGPSAILVLKGVDGVLRHTLQRTATEIVLVPMPALRRRYAKVVADLGGQKGGQALASLMILGVNSVHAGGFFPWLLVALSALWVVAVCAVRGPYLALVREHLRKPTQPSPLPDLDVQSLESLVLALDSTDGAEVLAAMELLENEGKPRMIPTLILYHPDDDVVVRALSLFARSRRERALPAITGGLRKRSDRVRAAATRAAHELGLQSGAAADGPVGPAMRATVLAAKVGAGTGTAADLEALVALIESGDEILHRSMAEDVRVYNAAALEPVVQRLLKVPDATVRQQMLSAMDPQRFPKRRVYLLDALTDVRCRDHAHHVIASLGADGEALVRRAFADETLDPAIRRELPQAARYFPADVAGGLLQEWLAHERDGLVVYWLLRSLNQVKKQAPQLRLNLAALQTHLDSNLARGYRYLARRVLLVEQGQRTSALPAFKLLVRLLREKERDCAGRVFRLLNLMRDDEDFLSIWRSVRSTNPRTRAAGLELLDNAVPEPVRTALRGLIEDSPDRYRMAAGRRYQPFEHRPYKAVLDELEASESRSLRELTRHHCLEIERLHLDVTEEQPVPLQLREVPGAG